MLSERVTVGAADNGVAYQRNTGIDIRPGRATAAARR